MRHSIELVELPDGTKIHLPVVVVNGAAGLGDPLFPGRRTARGDFDFRRVRSLRGRWRPQYTPNLTQRTALLRKLKEIFRRYDSQPVGRVITEINPILRGWVRRQ